jgi:hypothetical protein
MLAYAGGDFVDVRYAPSNLVAYLRPDGFSISSRFPFIDGPRSVPTVYLDAVYDITYRTPSLIAVTPLLVGLGVWGSIVGVRAVRRDARIRRVAFLATVGVPAAATLLIWGFIAPRYLADFLPLLIPLSLLGLGGLSTVLDRSGRRLRTGVLAVVAVLGCWSIAAGAALAVSSSYLTGPDGDAAELVRIQGRGSFWDSTPGRDAATIDDFRFDRTNPPPPGTIAILGACEAAYLSSGEPVDPWLTLAYGPNEFRRVFEVTVAESPEPSSVRLATFTSAPPNDPEAQAAFELFLVVDEQGNVSLQLADEFGVVPYPLDVAPGDTFELGVTSDPVRKSMFFEVDGTTAGYGHYLTRSLYDADGQIVEFFPGDQQRGLDVRALRAPPAPC